MQSLRKHQFDCTVRFVICKRIFRLATAVVALPYMIIEFIAYNTRFLQLLNCSILIRLNFAFWRFFSLSLFLRVIVVVGSCCACVWPNFELAADVYYMNWASKLYLESEWCLEFTNGIRWRKLLVFSSDFYVFAKNLNKRCEKWPDPRSAVKKWNKINFQNEWSRYIRQSTLHKNHSSHIPYVRRTEYTTKR